MKGIVFTEFLELVEIKFGLEIVQKIIDECDLDTNGVYTSVGTYSHKDMFKMVGKLAQIKGISVPEWFAVFGEYFFVSLSSDCQKFMDGSNLYGFIKDIKKQIHPEVLKLWPDKELPQFKLEIKSKKMLEIINNPLRLALNRCILSDFK